MRLSAIAKMDIFIFSPMIKKGVTVVFYVIDNSNACIDLKNSASDSDFTTTFMQANLARL